MDMPKKPDMSPAPAFLIDAEGNEIFWDGRLVRVVSGKDGSQIAWFGEPLWEVCSTLPEKGLPVSKRLAFATNPGNRDWVSFKRAVKHYHNIDVPDKAKPRA